MKIVLGKLKHLLIFLSGFFCYYLVFLLTKLPIVQHLIHVPDRTIFGFKSLIDPIIAYIFLISFFEVTVIFLFRNFFFKKSKKLSEAALFGFAFGFGVYANLFPFNLDVVPDEITWSPILLLINLPLLIFHILLAVLIWNSFVVKKRCLYFFIGIFLRMLVTSVFFNSISPFGSYSNEIIVFVIALLLGGFLFYNGKLERPNFDEISGGKL